MNVKAFVEAIEEYFGKYTRPAVKVRLVGYVKDFSDSDRGKLFDAMVLDYGYKDPPMIAHFEKVVRELKINQRQQIYFVALPKPDEGKAHLKKLVDMTREKLGIREVTF